MEKVKRMGNTLTNCVRSVFCNAQSSLGQNKQEKLQDTFTHKSRGQKPYPKY